MQRQKRCKMCNSQKKGKTHLLFSHPDEKFLQIKNQLGREGLVVFFIFTNKEPREEMVAGGVFSFLKIKNQGKGWLRVVFPTVKINQGPRPLNKSGKRRPGQSGISIELPSFPTCVSQRTDRSFFLLKTARSRTSGHLSEDEPK